MRRLAIAPVFLVALGLPARSGDRPDDVRESVQRDCRAYLRFFTAHHPRLRELVTRGAAPEAEELCGRLLSEERRTLERVLWYIGQEPSRKSQHEKLRKLFNRVESTTPTAALRKLVDDGYAPPAWLAEPLAWSDGDAAPAPASATLSSAESPRRYRLESTYGVAAPPVTPVLKIVAATEPAPAASPSPGCDCGHGTH